MTSYTALINNVLSVFRPGRMVVTLMADAAGLKELVDNPFDESKPSTFFGQNTPSGARSAYGRTSSSFTMVEGDTCMQMGNWELARPGGKGSKRLRAAFDARTHRKQNRSTSF